MGLTMLITKEQILAQIQQDNSIYETFPPAFRETLRAELALVRRPSNRNDREAAEPHLVSG